MPIKSKTEPKPPKPFIKRVICKNVSKLRFPFIRFFSRAFISFSLKFSSAFFTKAIISPKPKIRSAKRAGSNSSRASIFSPVDKNLILMPAPSTKDKAAPPLASPSILVKIAPVKPI